MTKSKALNMLSCEVTFNGISRNPPQFLFFFFKMAIGITLNNEFTAQISNTSPAPNEICNRRYAVISEISKTAPQPLLTHMTEW